MFQRGNSGSKESNDARKVLSNVTAYTVLDPIKKVCFRSINEAKGGFKRKVKDSERKEVNKRVELISIVAE